MKIQKLILATLIFSMSIFAFDSAMASQQRVRTVPSSTDQKKKEAAKTSTTSATSTTTTSVSQQGAKQQSPPCTNSQKSTVNQSKLLQATVWINNGGMPK